MSNYIRFADQAEADAYVEKHSYKKVALYEANGERAPGEVQSLHTTVLRALERDPSNIGSIEIWVDAESDTTEVITHAKNLRMLEDAVKRHFERDEG